jgi:hypothetical protein
MILSKFPACIESKARRNARSANQITHVTTAWCSRKISFELRNVFQTENFVLNSLQ